MSTDTLTANVSTETARHAAPVAPRPALTLADRCDGPGVQSHFEDRLPYCGAQAFVRVFLADNRSLDFCGHHYATYETIFFAGGYDVQDERLRINEKPGQNDSA